MMIESNIREFKIIKEIIPSGAWANVYIARYKGKIVALKVLKKEFSTNPKVVEDFFNEAEALSKFNQRNIAELITIGEKHFPYHFAMKYYSGGNLENFLKKHSGITLEKAVQIIISIANALDGMNKLGFLHLDLKPHNILFDKFQGVVLTDFGAAKNIVFTNNEDERQGTPQYMSPEHFDIDKPLSFSSDLYSLGVIFYRIVTGELPFKSDNYQTLSVMHISQLPKKPSSIKKGISKTLDEIILKLLSKKPDDRYSTAQELIEDLRKYQLNLTFSNYNLELSLYDIKGNLKKKNKFSRFPVKIARGQKEKDVFTVFNGLEQYNWIKLNNNGKLISVKSDLNEKLICNDEDYHNPEMLLYQNNNLLIFNENLLRIKKIKKAPKMILSLALIPFIIFMFYYYINFVAVELPTLKYNFSKNPLTTEESLSIDVLNNVINGEKIIKYKFAPYGIKKDKFETASLDNFWSYPSDSILYKEKTFQFALKGIFQDGSETEWAQKNVIVKPINNKIILSNLKLPKYVKKGQMFKYYFDVKSKFPPELLNVSIRLINKKSGKVEKNTTGVSMSSLTHKYKIRKTGEYNFSIYAFSDDGTISNNISRKIVVTPPITNPNLIVKKFFVSPTLRISIFVNCSDIKYFQDSLKYELFIDGKNIGQFAGTQHLLTSKLTKDGEHKFFIKVLAPDFREKKSDMYIINTKSPIIKIENVKFNNKKLRLILSRNNNYKIRKLYLIVNDNNQFEISPTSKFISLNINDIIPRKIYLLGIIRNKQLTMTNEKKL